MSVSSIEWTDAVWNPVRGCTRVSEGCRHCYAERMYARNLPEMRSPTTGKAFAQQTPHGPRWTGKVELIPSKLDEPLRWREGRVTCDLCMGTGKVCPRCRGKGYWRRPLRVFVNSMSDLFHEALPDAAIDRIFAVMADAPQHTFQILTKRPARMLAFLTTDGAQIRMASWMKGNHRQPVPGVAWNGPWPLPNVWLGVSVEDQATADERIPLLLRTPAAVHFVSYEPALGPVDFRPYLFRNRDPRFRVCPRCLFSCNDGTTTCPNDRALLQREDIALDWIIVGGESGPGARPFDLAWARSTIQQCRAAGVAVFFKQAGSWPYMTPHLGPTNSAYLNRCALGIYNRKGADPAEWPEDLRVREFPHA